MIVSNIGSGAMLVPWRTSTTACCASFSTSSTDTNHKSIKTENLREQLDHLHKEADNTRAKANSARLRLLRLSEAAEKLRRQAALSVHTGKENYARELLLQKKKVMEAMEKSKGRIELLDELSAKLNEAISMKETQLIGKVASELDVHAEYAPSPVRIVSPSEEASNKKDENEDLLSGSMNHCDVDELEAVAPSRADLHTDGKTNSKRRVIFEDTSNESVILHNLKDLSSYEDFLELLDQQLQEIEGELVAVLKFSTLILGSNEKLEHAKSNQALEILKGIRSIRGRIASIIQTAEIR